MDLCDPRSLKTRPQQLMFIHLCLFVSAESSILTGLYIVDFYLTTYCIMRQLRCRQWQLANH